MSGTTKIQDKAAYDNEYQAEMDRLNAEAAGTTATTPEVKTEATTPAEQPVEKTEQTTETPDERFARLESELNSTKKALNDTKRWAQESNTRAKRLEQEREAERRAANKPEVLADNPGLEEAIQYVAGVPSSQKDATAKQDEWATAVGTALPDLDTLLDQSPELRAKAAAKRTELGEDWFNPYIAIRELGKLQAEHERASVAAAAQTQARQDFEKSKQKQTAMSVPGGGSSSRPPANPAADPARYATMSSVDFAKERAKVLGY
jgi:hypothetical protein